MVQELKEKDIIEPEIDLSSDDVSFAEAHVQIIQGSQRGGKTCLAVGKVVSAYHRDCVRIFCKKVLKMECEVKAYYPKDRVAKVKVDGKEKYIRIPEDYELKSPMRIFSNIHLYGIPYVYVPSFVVMERWLRIGFICNGWLIMDEAHVGMGARNGQSKLGRGLVTQCMQFGKSKLEVMMITHMPRLIDWVGRTIPTKAVDCSYDEKTRTINFTLKEKGQTGTSEHSFDATQYWPYYKTNEKVNK
jgi:hypothetical protein